MKLALALVADEHGAGVQALGLLGDASGKGGRRGGLQSRQQRVLRVDVRLLAHLAAAGRAEPVTLWNLCQPNALLVKRTRAALAADQLATVRANPAEVVVPVQGHLHPGDRGVQAPEKPLGFPLPLPLPQGLPRPRCPLLLGPPLLRHSLQQHRQGHQITPVRLVDAVAGLLRPTAGVLLELRVVHPLSRVGAVDKAGGAANDAHIRNLHGGARPVEDVLPVRDRPSSNKPSEAGVRHGGLARGGPRSLPGGREVTRGAGLLLGQLLATDNPRSWPNPTLFRIRTRRRPLWWWYWTPGVHQHPLVRQPHKLLAWRVHGAPVYLFTRVGVTF